MGSMAIVIFALASQLKLSESEQQQLDLSADAVMKVKQSLKQAK